VVVVARSKEDYEVECASVFAAVVQEVMEAKTEFFHSITPKTYLIDPGELNQTPLPSVSMQVQLYSQVPAIAIRKLPHFVNNVSHSDYILRKYELRDVYNIDGIEIATHFRNDTAVPR